MFGNEMTKKALLQATSYSRLYFKERLNCGVEALRSSTHHTHQETRLSSLRPIAMHVCTWTSPKKDSILMRYLDGSVFSSVP